MITYDIENRIQETLYNFTMTLNHEFLNIKLNTFMFQV